MINPKPNLILAIDPGVTGALALYNLSTSQLEDVQDLPSKHVGKKIRIDSAILALTIENVAPRVRFALIEEVGAMPKNGSVSMFSFGHTAGTIHGIITANMIPQIYVHPGVWKGALGLSSNKEESLAKAIKLFPAHAHLFSRKKDHGRAEAALLAIFGARHA